MQALAYSITLLAKPIHPSFCAVPRVRAIHAARVSMAYQSQVRAASASGSVPWTANIAGFLILSWGGMILTHHLLQIPPPILYELTPYIVYLSTHFLLSAIFKVFPGVFSYFYILDTILVPLDAVVRTAAITGALSHLRLPSNGGFIHPALPPSPLAHLVIGALAAYGGSLLGGSLSVWSPTWTFSTPPLLRTYSTSAFLWSSLDLWSAALVSATYGFLTNHPAFSSTQLDLGSDDRQMWTELEASTLAALVLSILLGFRVYKIHWAGKRSWNWEPAKEENAVKKTQ